MPTITIESHCRTTATHRAVAARLTRYLRDQGVAPSHVVVRFSELAPMSVYSAAVPVEATGPDTRPPVLVTCCVGPERGEDFLTGLAAEVRRLATAHLDAGWAQVRFVATEPHHVYVGHGPTLVRADELGDGPEGGRRR